jgi:hypothetical protein
MLNIGREAPGDYRRLALYCMMFAARASAVQTAAHTWRDVVRERRMTKRKRPQSR